MNMEESGAPHGLRVQGRLMPPMTLTFDHRGRYEWVDENVARLTAPVMGSLAGSNRRAPWYASRAMIRSIEMAQDTRGLATATVQNAGGQLGPHPGRIVAHPTGTGSVVVSIAHGAVPSTGELAHVVDGDDRIAWAHAKLLALPGADVGGSVHRMMRGYPWGLAKRHAQALEYARTTGRKATYVEGWNGRWWAASVVPLPDGYVSFTYHQTAAPAPVHGPDDYALGRAS